MYHITHQMCNSKTGSVAVMVVRMVAMVMSGRPHYSLQLDNPFRHVTYLQ